MAFPAQAKNKNTRNAIKAKGSSKRRQRNKKSTKLQESLVAERAKRQANELSEMSIVRAKLASNARNPKTLSASPAIWPLLVLLRALTPELLRARSSDLDPASFWRVLKQ